MKIAFVSTRGIPNNYGGFEEFAERLGERLVKRGHEVVVYNPSFHPFRGDKFNGVRIVRTFSPEPSIGTAANFIFDYLSLRHAVKKEECNAVIVCGYTTAAVSFLVCGFGESKVLTNMDGLEWKRSKWSPAIQGLAKRFEKIAAERSTALIADNIGIAEHLESEYGKKSFFIPYGAEPFRQPDQARLADLDLDAFGYNLLVGRMEPENNFEMILEGAADADLPTVVVSNTDTRYGRELTEKYSAANVRFIGWVGDRELLSNLRHFAAVHFHGHSVGGTNPSLLEAMACGAFIAAHDNIFNRSVLGTDALYFKDAGEVAALVKNAGAMAEKRENFIAHNLVKINETYNWNRIADQYEKMLFEVTGN